MLTMFPKKVEMSVCLKPAWCESLSVSSLIIISLSLMFCLVLNQCMDNSQLISI